MVNSLRERPGHLLSDREWGSSLRKWWECLPSEREQSPQSPLRQDQASPLRQRQRSLLSDRDQVVCPQKKTRAFPLQKDQRISPETEMRATSLRKIGGCFLSGRDQSVSFQTDIWVSTLWDKVSPLSLRPGWHLSEKDQWLPSETKAYSFRKRPGCIPLNQDQSVSSWTEVWASPLRLKPGVSTQKKEWSASLLRPWSLPSEKDQSFSSQIEIRAIYLRKRQGCLLLARDQDDSFQKKTKVSPFRQKPGESPLRKTPGWSSPVAQQVKDPALSLQQLCHCCGTGWIPGPGIASCHRCGQKKKERERERKKKTRVGVPAVAHQDWWCLYNTRRQVHPQLAQWVKGSGIVAAAT